MTPSMGFWMSEVMGRDRAVSTVERDIGRIEGVLEAHKDRMDRTDASNAVQFQAIHTRFDAVKLNLDEQDKKLDVILLRTSKQDGASSVWRKIFGGAGQIALAAISGGLGVKAYEWAAGK